jgi:peptidoglycan/xylan/chitin deacetylase (PgdA/CDA1 family)
MQASTSLQHRIARAAYRAVRGAFHAGIGSRSAMSIAKLCGVRKASVFMFHRFSEDPRIGGTHPDLLRQMLASLRRQGVAFLRLSDLLSYVAERRELPGPTAVITVDDGYADFAHLAAPILEGFDVRPTVFLVSEFVAGRQWCWWDRVGEAFDRTERTEFELPCNGQQLHFRIEGPGDRRPIAQTYIEALKRVSNDDRLTALAMLGSCLEVELPDTPPPQYAALTWDTIRRLERAGVDFAPHTMTHPILSRTTPEQLRMEIAGSWSALRANLADPTPIFCYPNGTADSYGPREIAMLRKYGMLGAVAFRPSYVDPSVCTETDRFSLARFAAPEDVPSASYLASGLAWNGD